MKIDNKDKILVTLNADNWDVSFYERKGGKMKFVIKLNKDEAIAFKNFSNVIKPGEVSDDDFIKSIFFSGWEAMNNRMTQLSKEYVKENKEKLEKEGIDVDRLLDESEDLPTTTEIPVDDESSGGIEVIK